MQELNGRTESQPVSGIDTRNINTESGLIRRNHIISEKDKNLKTKAWGEGGRQ